MKNQFADYETSRMLRALGFNVSCMKYYTEEKELLHAACFNKEVVLDKECAAPLWQQVEEWIFDQKKYYIEVHYLDGCYYYRNEHVSEPPTKTVIHKDVPISLPLSFSGYSMI